MTAWEIEGDASGPMSEALLIQRIEQGLPAVTKARPEGAEKFRPIGAHEPFAAALDRARPSVLRAQATGAGGVLVVLALAAAAWFAVGGKVIIAKGAEGYSASDRTFIVLP